MRSQILHNEISRMSSEDWGVIQAIDKCPILEVGGSFVSHLKDQREPKFTLCAINVLR
uniref:Uncharacterized protein n=1 Tax=Octopus bimaculoides TaxID=37653 RepID=A0A0L8GYG3_OCTBM